MTTARRAGTASAAVLLGLALTLGVAHATAPEWTRSAGLDVWNLTKDQEAIRATIEQSARLKLEAEALHQSIETIGHVSSRLAKGSLSLADAATMIEPVMRDRPGFVETYNYHYPSPTFRHAVARFLIGTVKRRFETDPSSWCLIWVRLEREYAELTRRWSTS